MSRLRSKEEICDSELHRSRFEGWTVTADALRLDSRLGRESDQYKNVFELQTGQEEPGELTPL